MGHSKVVLSVLFGLSAFVLTWAVFPRRSQGQAIPDPVCNVWVLTAPYDRTGQRVELSRTTARVYERFKMAVNMHDECGCGRYQQLVRGAFYVDDIPVPHKLKLSPDEYLDHAFYKEDGPAVYGERSGSNRANDRYSRPPAPRTDERRDGCVYNGEDEPSLRGPRSAHLEARLEFLARVIPTMEHNTQLCPGAAVMGDTGPKTWVVELSY